MSNKPPPGKKLVGDWQGMNVRLVREIATGAATYPAGMTGVITGIYGGLQVLGDPCPCCGVKLRIYKLSSEDVEPV